MTDVPAQMVLDTADDATDTDGVTVELTVIVIAFEVAVVGFAQEELEVSTTVITSLFAKVVVV